MYNFELKKIARIPTQPTQYSYEKIEILSLFFTF